MDRKFDREIIKFEAHVISSKAWVSASELENQKAALAMLRNHTLEFRRVAGDVEFRLHRLPCSITEKRLTYRAARQQCVDRLFASL